MKFQLFASIFQIIIGLLAIASFVVLGLNGENMAKWIITLALAVSFVALGIIGIFNYKSKR